MIIAFTGHRPERMPYTYFNESIRHRLIDKLNELKPKGVIQGMARGFDILGAGVCYELGIRYVAAIPWKGHINMSVDYQTAYNRAYKRVIISSEYTKDVYLKRDYWMVDHADLVIAAYDGKPVGGTYKTIQYAESLGKVIYNIWN